MGDDDGSGAVGDGIGEDLARMHLGFVDEADGHDAGGDDFIRAVERDAQKVLLLAVGIMANQWQHIRWKGDFQSFGADAAASKRKSCDRWSAKCGERRS